GRPTNAVQQTGLTRRMVGYRCCDYLTRFQATNLHSPEVFHIVDDIIACAVDGVGSENARIGPDARYRIAARINKIEVSAAAVPSLCFLEDWPRQRVLGIVRSVGEIHLANDVASTGIENIDVIRRTALPGRNVEQLPVRIDCQPIDTGADLFVPDNRIV